MRDDTEKPGVEGTGPTIPLVGQPVHVEEEATRLEGHLHDQGQGRELDKPVDRRVGNSVPFSTSGTTG